jgi:hypothetical protein
VGGVTVDRGTSSFLIHGRVAWLKNPTVPVKVKGEEQKDPELRKKGGLRSSF